MVDSHFEYSQLRPGAVIDGRYRIERRVGQGGFGVVYRAEEMRTGRVIALKLMLPPASGDTTATERFWQEAAVARMLRHPHIVRVEEFNRIGNLWYLTMQWSSGGDLATYLADRGKRLPFGEAVRIVDQILDALGHAHGQGAVHRDMKPQNVLLEEKPDGMWVRVSDFGIAKAVSEGWPTQVLGTPAYMAPEQVRNPSGVDGRADIYAVGLILREVVTGVAARGPDPLPSQLDPSLPRSLDFVVLHALEQDPADRYPDATEFRIALQALKR